MDTLEQARSSCREAVSQVLENFKSDCCGSELSFLLLIYDCNASISCGRGDIEDAKLVAGTWLREGTDKIKKVDFTGVKDAT